VTQLLDGHLAKLAQPSRRQLAHSRPKK
jgi:hypothetical protein